MAAGYHKRRGVGLVVRRRLRVARRAAAVVLTGFLDPRRSPAGHNSRQGETGKSFGHPLLPDVIGEHVAAWPEHRRGGFSVDRSVHLPAGDRAGTERMVTRPAACGGVPACGSRPKPPRRNRRPGRHPRHWARVSRPRPPTDRRSSRNRRPAAAPARPGPPAVDEIPRFDQVGHRPRVGNGAGVCRGPASGQATPLPAMVEPRCLSLPIGPRSRIGCTAIAAAAWPWSYCETTGSVTNLLARRLKSDNGILLLCFITFPRLCSRRLSGVIFPIGFLGDEEANRLRSRALREPWRIGCPSYQEDRCMSVTHRRAVCGPRYPACCWGCCSPRAARP